MMQQNIFFPKTVLGTSWLQEQALFERWLGLVHGVAVEYVPHMEADNSWLSRPGFDSQPWDIICMSSLPFSLSTIFLS